MKRIGISNQSHSTPFSGIGDSSRCSLAPPSRYLSRISLYDTPPTEEISLEELEQLAIDRLRLLKYIETLSIRQAKDEEFQQKLKAFEDKYVPLHSNDAWKGYSLDEERRRDHLGHYILRLGFCIKEETRRWFVTQESLLFKYRYQHEKSEDRLKLLQSAMPSLIQVEDTERNTYQHELVSSSGYSSLNDNIFKVPFEQVLDLVSKRSVFVLDGWAYVPRSESSSIILNRFRNNLENDLEILSRYLPKLQEDERLLPILMNICHSADDDNDRAVTGAQGTPSLTASDVDKYVGHFPLCMQHLHYKLREESHLKHGGRMQYGLYLKSIGVSLEEAIVFWKKAFSKKLADDKFSKDYLYNIRHNYGQEGKRANYAPYSCHKIITTSPPYHGDHHGCPFRHFGEDRLIQMLTNLRLTGAKLGEKALNASIVGEIMALVKEHHYQIACTRLFELSRKITDFNIESVITHPHQFFEWSVKASQNEINK